MLVFDRENWPNHRSWCLAIVIAATAAAIGYVAYGWGSGSWNWPGGVSPPGFAYGVVGGGIILFEMLLWPRKSLWRGWRLGRTKLWMTAHIWLGLLTLPLLLLHGGFHFNLANSTLAAVLMWLVVIVVGSGVLGLVLQNILPRIMLEQVPAETIYSQIGHILEQYRAEAERLVELTCGRSPVHGDAENDQATAGEPAIAAPSFVSVGSVRTGRIVCKARWCKSASRRPGCQGLRACSLFTGTRSSPIFARNRGDGCSWVRRYRRRPCSRLSRPVFGRSPIRS